MGIATGREYVKTSGDKIYVRGSCFDSYSHNSFYAHEAREIASRIVKAADKLEGTGTSAGPVTLTLERGEAEALASVLHRIGGDPILSPRGKITAVQAKLTKAGVNRPTSHKFECIAGGLWFKKNSGQAADDLAKWLAEAVYSFVDE